MPIATSSLTLSHGKKEVHPVVEPKNSLVFLITLFPCRETKDNDRPAEDKSWQMMNDIPLQNLVKEAKEYLLSLSDERGQYAALAR